MFRKWWVRGRTLPGYGDHREVGWETKTEGRKRLEHQLRLPGSARLWGIRLGKYDLEETLQSWSQIKHSLKEIDRTYDKRNRNRGHKTRWLTKTGHKCRPKNGCWDFLVVMQGDRPHLPPLLNIPDGTQHAWKPVVRKPKSVSQGEVDWEMQVLFPTRAC